MATTPASWTDNSLPTLSQPDLRAIADAAARALAAWDQYTIQSRLPRDSRWLDQGSHWDDFNNGHLAAQERHDPIVVSEAWNEVERALLELSNLTARLRDPHLATTLRFQDRRSGAFSRISGRRAETAVSATTAPAA